MSRTPTTLRNAERRHPSQTSPSTAMFVDDFDNEPGLREYRDMLHDNKWLISWVIGIILIASLIYVVLATPIYRANLLIQIEDSAPESKSFLTDTTGLGELKTTANGEIQVIGSRMVLGAAVDQVGLQTQAQPRYLPIFGKWLARNAKGLSDPGIFGIGGFVNGTERILVNRFVVPASFEDSEPFVVTVQGDGLFSVTHELLENPIEGRVGKLLQHNLSEGPIDIQIDELVGKKGAEFTVSVSSRLRAIEGLQSRLLMSEQGRQSNVVNVALEDSDPLRLGKVLNSVADQYVRQNVERKSAEAEKTLAFLDAQLPLFERQLKTSEDAFARFRNQNGTVAFDEEAKVWLKSSADLQTNLLELQQSRLELRRTNNDSHPKIQTLNQQISAVQAELSTVNRRITAMPNVQRDALRLERDVRANSAQYQSMQNNALQMRLLREGKVGNVRLLDKAVVSKIPVKPQKALIIAFSIVMGVLVALGLAVVRTRSKKDAFNATEITAKTGLEVFGVIPESVEQSTSVRGKISKLIVGQLLADTYPHSHSVEAMRALRIALKSVAAGAKNNCILITGATTGIGKSFLANNLALLLAQTGKRVLLINADLRKEGESEYFALRRDGGLAELLNNGISVEQAIRKNIRPNLDVITTGKLPQIPADILESPIFSETLEALSQIYDQIVIDAAPVLIGADALAVAPYCGTVLLVAREGISESGALIESIRRLTQAGASVDGLILNGTDPSKIYGGSYGGRYSEAADSARSHAYAGG